MLRILLIFYIPSVLTKMWNSYLKCWNLQIQIHIPTQLISIYQVPIHETKKELWRHDTLIKVSVQQPGKSYPKYYFNFLLAFFGENAGIRSSVKRSIILTTFEKRSFVFFFCNAFDNIISCTSNSNSFLVYFLPCLYTAVCTIWYHTIPKNAIYVLYTRRMHNSTSILGYCCTIFHVWVPLLPLYIFYFWLFWEKNSRNRIFPIFPSHYSGFLNVWRMKWIIWLLLDDLLIAILLAPDFLCTGLPPMRETTTTTPITSRGDIKCCNVILGAPELKQQPIISSCVVCAFLKCML